MTVAEEAGETGPIGRPSVLARLQRGLERLYRVKTDLAVDAFLVDETERARVGVARAPREQMLVDQSDADELRLGLFVEGRALSNLEQNDPAHTLGDANFADFCIAVEGVSHFVYLATCAAGDRSVTALELELQAEVDKFVCCVLRVPTPPGPRDVSALRRQLYDDVSFAPDLDDLERERYVLANAQARRYTSGLATRFLAADRVADMLPELRRFYRLDLGHKLGHISRMAG